MEAKIKTPVAILGFGTEGRAAYEFLKAEGISDIHVFDQNDKADIPEGVEATLSLEAFDYLTDYKTIIRSPGVHYKLPGILEAKAAGTTVTSMTELTLEGAKRRMTCITGSNGKTSTRAMTAAILDKHYQGNLIVGGNDAKPILLDATSKPTLPILMEVSSFQFADIHTSPQIAAVLNISPNHMDWHENMEDYIHAKQNLIAHQGEADWAVLNSNNENSAKLAEKAPGKVFWIGRKNGDHYAYWEGETLKAKNGHEEMEVLKKEDLVVKTHPDNVAFAVAIGLLHSAKPSLIKEALSEFKGVEHRLEFVREIDSIKFYNDSACTTPESAIVAINQFQPGKAILLLGGSSKESDFRFLAGRIADTRTGVCLYGDEATRLKKAIQEEEGDDLILNPDGSSTFIEVVQAAYRNANPNDNIVLSPACASFDMFKNSKDRGKQFKDIVNSL